MRSHNAIGLLAAMCVLAGCSSAAAGLADRQTQVADAGAQVMPFDLDATTHIFTNKPDGGIQDVVADNPDDDDSISEIREHLRVEVDKFQAGDFSDPESIHGSDMPGLATLQARFSEIAVELELSETGASISYVAVDPALVTAIHDGFQAQTSDHGKHAEHGSS